MKTFPDIYGCLGVAAAISSPGVALIEELPAESGFYDSRFAQTIEAQNRIIQARVVWADQLLLSMHRACGSGGAKDIQRYWIEAGSRSVHKAKQPSTKSSTQVFDVDEVVADIRSALSLQIKELAEILGVQRPTIYSWLQGNQKPQEHNRDRLIQLQRVAAIWNGFNHLPLGKAVREKLNSDGKSLVDFLKQESLDIVAIESHMRAMSDQLSKQILAPSEQKKSVRELATIAGQNLSLVGDQQMVIDVMTGKRVHED